MMLQTFAHEVLAGLGLGVSSADVFLKVPNGPKGWGLKSIGGNILHGFWWFFLYSLVKSSKLQRHLNLPSFSCGAELLFSSRKIKVKLILCSAHPGCGDCGIRTKWGGPRGLTSFIQLRVQLRSCSRGCHSSTRRHWPLDVSRCEGPPPLTRFPLLSITLAISHISSL